MAAPRTITAVGRLAPLILLGLASLCGCVSQNAARTDQPDLDACVQLILPKRIEITRWTQPTSFANTGDADGLEIILAAYDSFGDLTKMVGTLRFELNQWRATSAEQLGEQVALWKVEMDSREKLIEHWDPLARYYRFPVQLAKRPLPPGRYVLTAWLLGPNDERLTDRREFQYESGQAVPAKTKR